MTDEKFADEVDKVFLRSCICDDLYCLSVREVCMIAIGQIAHEEDSRTAYDHDREPCERIVAVSCGEDFSLCSCPLIS